MFRLLLLIVLTVLLTSGCSHKKHKSSVYKANVVQVKNTRYTRHSLQWCVNNIKESANGFTFTDMTNEEFDSCMIKINNSKINKQTEKIASLDLSRFGVKSVYTIDEARDVQLIKLAHIWLYSKQKYILDSEKFAGKSDVHEDLYPYIKFLEENYDLATSYEGFKNAYQAMDYSDIHFTFKDGKWYVQGDCESTYRTYESHLIKQGLNPQRLFEAFTDVCTDAGLTTAKGGHMFGFYLSPTGKNYTIEQLDHPRTMGVLISKRFYRMKEFRRADQPISNFKVFPKQMLEDFVNERPVMVHPTNEV